ncbi:hypothetical protein D3C80_1694070 [compost metagenome]
MEGVTANSFANQSYIGCNVFSKAILGSLYRYFSAGFIWRACGKIAYTHTIIDLLLRKKEKQISFKDSFINVLDGRRACISNKR